MTIALTGGGSGGHITPVLAVAAELKRIQPNARVVYIGQKGDSLGDIPAKDPNVDTVYTVRAGKFRRFHGEGLQQLFDLPTMAKNFRDIFYVILGIYQSWRIMGKVHPDVLFSRGGFVSVPVATGARLHKIPYITHDSDLTPSLANRIIAKGASLHADALDKELYTYPQDKTITTGIPLNTNFKPVTSELKKMYRKQIEVPVGARLLFVIGGGLGSQDINSAVTDIVPHLLHDFSDLYIVHAAGRINADQVERSYKDSLEKADTHRVIVRSYIEDVYRYSGAADIVVTRAGATNLAEFAVQGKACIIIPSSFLAGGHQLKNAEYLAEQGAAVVLKATDLVADSNRLARSVTDLLNDEAKRKKLANELASLGQPNAARIIAELIMEQK